MVNIITGIAASAASDFSAESTDQPSVSGMSTSRVITRGRNSRASLRPSFPSAAKRTVKPSPRSVLSISRCTLGSSSITSTDRSASAGGVNGPSGIVNGSVGLRFTTCTGSSITNVEPWPGSLFTLMVPPIISQRCLVIVSPRPWPPNLRAVESSAWLKA